MTLTDFLPKDVSLTVAMALCAIAFVSGTARGFSGFGSALIFMPLASSVAASAPGRRPAPRDRFRGSRAAAAGRLAEGRPQGHRRDRARRIHRRARRHVFSQRARTGHHALDHLRLRHRAAGCCCCRAGAIAARITPGCRSASAASPASAAGWRRPAVRRSSATGWGVPIAPIVARANILLFFGASDFFSMVSYATTGLISRESLAAVADRRAGLCDRRRLRRLAVRPRQRDDLSQDLLRA